MTSVTTVATDIKGAVAAGSPAPGPEAAGARSLIVTGAVRIGGRAGADVPIARWVGAAALQDLLRRRADLPADDPGRTLLRARSIEAGLPLARSLARRYRGRGEPLDDLYQVAALALVKAVDGYDPTRPTAFASYAVPTILGALKRHFRDTAWQLRVPRRVQELALRLTHTSAGLTQQLRRSPTLRELAQHLDATEEDVVIARYAWHASHTGSLDAAAAAGNCDGPTIADTIGTLDARLDAVADRQALQPSLAALPIREQRVLTMRYYGEMTQSEIAARIGVSQMQVSRLLIRALDQLRTSMLAQHLAEQIAETRGESPRAASP